jgi:hypothetical protein
MIKQILLDIKASTYNYFYQRIKMRVYSYDDLMCIVIKVIWFAMLHFL